MYNVIAGQTRFGYWQSVCQHTHVISPACVGAQFSAVGIMQHHFILLVGLHLGIPFLLFVHHGAHHDLLAGAVDASVCGDGYVLFLSVGQSSFGVICVQSPSARCLVSRARYFYIYVLSLLSVHQHGTFPVGEECCEWGEGVLFLILCKDFHLDSRQGLSFLVIHHGQPCLLVARAPHEGSQA